MIKLTKYKNRKIYNPKTHEYVALKDIIELIKKDDIQIINSFGEDETKTVLVKAMLSCDIKESDIVELIRKAKK